MANKAKIAVKIIVFILLFILLFTAVSEVLRYKSLTGAWNMTQKIHGLKSERQNSMDVMFFGSSHMYCTISPLQLMAEYGFTSYVYCTQQQPLWATYHYMKEALKTQAPKLIVVEMYMATNTEDYLMEGAESAIIELDMSANKLGLINSSVEKSDRLGFVFDIIRYHDRWSELKANDFDISYRFKTDPFKGYVLLDHTEPRDLNYQLSSITKSTKLTEKNLEYIQKIIELAKSVGSELWFLVSPYEATAEQQAVYNSVKQIADSNNIRFINYNNDYDSLCLDPQVDFYDKGHVNNVGAKKVTSDLGKKIKESIPLTDKRGQYEQWIDDYNKLLK